MRHDITGRGHYTLDEHGNAVQATDLHEWAAWFEAADRRVCRDLDEGDGDKRILVSTVFLGIDHRFFGEGPPILWETMVFGGLLDGEQNRYSSQEEAILGHQEMCMRVSETLHHPEQQLAPKPE